MQDDPPQRDVERYLKKQRVLTKGYGRHNLERSIRNANQPPSYDGSEECIDFDCDPGHSQAAFSSDGVFDDANVVEEEFIEDISPTTAPHLPKRRLWKRLKRYGSLLIAVEISLLMIWLVRSGYLPLLW